MASGESGEYSFTIRYVGESRDAFLPLPQLSCHFHGEGGAYHLASSIPLPLDLAAHFGRYPVEAQSAGLGDMARPSIDGDLDDAAWSDAGSLGTLQRGDLTGHVGAATEVYLTHDAQHLFVGVTCHEPEPHLVDDPVAGTDEDPSAEDSVELILQVEGDEIFHHLGVTRGGSLFDSRRANTAWSSGAETAVSAGEHSWSVEMAIPLGKVGIDLDAIDQVRFQFLRNRPSAGEEPAQWSPLLGRPETKPETFGVLRFQ